MLISHKDRLILREHAKKVAEIAALPIQEIRRQQWIQHNKLELDRPMILVFPEGSWEELLPQSELICASTQAREIEWLLRSRLYYHEHFQDDTVIENDWVVPKIIKNTGWGLEPKRIASPERRGAWIFDPVIHQPDDLKKLQHPEILYDAKETQKLLVRMQDLFGDILVVRLKGIAHISYHLMQQYTYLRGLEQTMMDMIANPAWLHEAMEFLTAGHEHILKQYIDQNLLSLNNDATYQNSGGNGYIDTLPAPDFIPDKVRPKDMWASAEAQELAGVSPQMHKEFSMVYEKRLLEPFGLTGYGCCEDLTAELDDVLTIPHIRRISISPFADVEKCAEKLGNVAIYSWKPNPAHLVGQFNEDAIRRYLTKAVRAAQRNNCVMEIVLKDTHTCEYHPDRFDRWLAIARDVRHECGY